MLTQTKSLKYLSDGQCGRIGRNIRMDMNINIKYNMLYIWSYFGTSAVYLTRDI